MNSFYPKLYALYAVLVALWANFSLVHNIQAANTTILLEGTGQHISIPSELIENWRGYTKLPQNKYLTRSPASLTSYLLRAAGAQPHMHSPASYAVYSYNIGQIYDWVASLANTVNTTPQNASLSIENNKAKTFTPPQNGTTINIYQTTFSIVGALEQKQTVADLVVDTTSPQIMLRQTNRLGINELIATGTSSFRGSPKNRKHNIAVGIEKMRGVIIAPGQEFSFNAYLGPVEASEGFLPELVIKRDKGTVPELGGGLCQVSSTTFRAAMQAGLPITERRNHAYAVQYYSPQGTDATIYPGIIDLKFINDTPGSILIWPYIKDEATVVFEFYGNRDGRVVTLDKPYQYDRHEDGSMKAVWKRSVTKDGITQNDVFKSNYLPPALFHKEEQFVPAQNPLTNPNQNPASVINPAASTNPSSVTQ